MNLSRQLELSRRLMEDRGIVVNSLDHQGYIRHLQGYMPDGKLLLVRPVVTEAKLGDLFNEIIHTLNNPPEDLGMREADWVIELHYWLRREDAYECRIVTITPDDLK